ncbi:MAG: hypothetical protein A2147_04750 [Chloroflexi bacterium RBG_16_57_8]|nr:MAG: hypothetical protein A2147_04750 [Chloroflexi bacterium RBG_16_57_8]
MKALVKTSPGAGGLELMDWPEPNAEGDQVKIEVAYTGICGTDLHILHGKWPSRPPVVLGHEFSGTVVEVGREVRDVAVGEKVVAGNPASTCGNCFHCRAGNPLMCPERISMGYMVDGCFAEYVVVRRGAVHKLPDHVSLRDAAVCEPLAVAVRTLIERATVQAGGSVLVSGPGPVGLLCVALAKAQGAKTIICGISQDEHRLACARRLGADHVVDVSKEDVVDVVRQTTGGAGADVVVECAGVADSLHVCFQSVRRGGTIVQVGIFPGPFEVDFNQVEMKELQIAGVYGYLWASWEKSVALLSEGRVKTDQLISHDLPLSAWEEGFRAAEGTEGIKVLLRPGCG